MGDNLEIEPMEVEVTLSSGHEELAKLLGVEEERQSTFINMEFGPSSKKAQKKLTKEQKEVIASASVESATKTLSLISNCATYLGIQSTPQDLELNSLLKPDLRYRELGIWKKIQQFNTVLCNDTKQLLIESKKDPEEDKTFLDYYKESITKYFGTELFQINQSFKYESAVPEECSVRVLLDCMEFGVPIYDDIEKELFISMNQ